MSNRITTPPPPAAARAAAAEPLPARAPTAPVAPAAPADAAARPDQLEDAALSARRERAVLAAAGPPPIVPQQKLALLPIDPRQPCRPDELMVAHYNVENLFDAEDDPLTHDEQFTPAGPTGYDEVQLKQHLGNLATAIRDMNGGRGPDILALTEIENAGIVERLRTEGLGDLGYQPVAHVDAGDSRGIEPALLTRYPILGEPVLHPVVNEAGKSFRGILEVNLDVHGRPLTVYVNHWIASCQGKNRERTFVERQFTAGVLRKLIDAKLAGNPGREIVALGDFNEGLGGAAFGDAGLPVADRPWKARKESKVLDTTELLARNQRPLGEAAGAVQVGTHYFVPDARWNTFDHLLVSHTLLDGEGLAWVPGSTAVYSPDSLRDELGAPRRFFLPRRGEIQASIDPQGTSDHFPVVMRLRIAGEQRRP